MTGAPKTEAEQVAFFEAAHAKFREARDRAGEVAADFDVAGTVVRLCFAGDRMASLLTRALDHLRVPAAASPDVTLCAWDSQSTGVRMAPPPCERERFTDRGDIWGFDSRRIKTAFHFHDFSVNLLDRERRVGLYWVNDAGALPYWASASPLRTLFHWWMETQGGQLLHAAAVGTDDGAVLITGRGGVGKSTTALACLQAGLNYVADDYVIVRLDPHPTVYSLYGTAKLDPGHLARFPALRAFVANGDRLADEKAVLFLHPHHRARMPRAMPLRALLVPRLGEGPETAARPEDPAVVQQAASFTTMSQLPNVGRHTHEFVTRLCAVLPSYVLELGRDVERIAPRIREVVRDHTRSPGRPAGPAATRDRPLVSVIIPVYNGERFLKDAVAAVVAQRYPSVEIIIVDDGSTDRTADVVGDLSCDVRYFRQENAGPAAARNRGIRDTAGDLIAFLDVDDLWPENTLATLADEMTRNPELRVVHGYAQLLERDPGAGTYEYRGDPRESFPYYVGAGLYRKRVFGEVGLFDPTLLFGEDVDWFNRVAERGLPVKRLDAVTLHVRRHGRNMTHDKSLVALNVLRVFKKALDRRRAAPDAERPDGDHRPAGDRPGIG
jgi:hypothetical protein